MPLPKVIVLTVPDGCATDGLCADIDKAISLEAQNKDAAVWAFLGSARLIDLEAEKQVRPKGLDRMDMGEADISALQAYNAALRMIAGEK